MKKIQVLKRIVIRPQGKYNDNKVIVAAIYGQVPDYIGTFDGWGCAAEEGIGTSTAAIVLKDSGFVELVEPSLVCFIVDNYNMYGAQFKQDNSYYRYGANNKVDIWVDSIELWSETSNLTNLDLLGDDYTPVT